MNYRKIQTNRNKGEKTGSNTGLVHTDKESIIV